MPTARELSDNEATNGAPARPPAVAGPPHARRWPSVGGGGVGGVGGTAGIGLPAATFGAAAGCWAAGWP